MAEKMGVVESLIPPLWELSQIFFIKNYYVFVNLFIMPSRKIV